MFDFGYVALDILYAYPEDSGTYTLVNLKYFKTQCRMFQFQVARNELGEAQCSLELQVGSDKVQYLDPLHPEGLERIQVCINFIEKDYAQMLWPHPEGQHFFPNLQSLS